MLIVLGAAAKWLGLREKENLARLRKTVRLDGNVDLLEEAASRKRRTCTHSAAKWYTFPTTPEA